MKKNRFVFVVPAFNAEKTVEQMLASVFYQTYDNWLILIRDDMSTDETVEKTRKMCERNSVPHKVREKHPGVTRSQGYYDDEHKPKVVVDVNKEKLWEVANVLAMIKDEDVQEDDIICRLDADDFLTDLCALQDLDAVYDEHEIDCLWTAHRWEDTHQNISAPMAPDADPYKHPWVTSHLKTFRKHLITNVNDENFRGEDGEYIKRAGDQAIYLPVLHNSAKRGYFPRMMYYYHIDMSPETFQTDDAKFQKSESEFLRARGYVSAE